jgi:hypothetical protein
MISAIETTASWSISFDMRVSAASFLAVRLTLSHDACDSPMVAFSPVK